MAFIQFEINPFPIPTGVTVKLPPGRRQDGIRPMPETLLHQLDKATVEQLCDDFKASVLAQWAKYQG